MKIHLSADYQSETWFSPIMSHHGHLIAVELVTQFVHETAPVTLPQHLLLPQLDVSQQLHLFQSQLNALEQHQAFFENRAAFALIRINHDVAITILESELLTRKIKRLPFLLLDICETFPQLSAGKNHPLLAALSAEFRLSLSHFGAGKSPANAVYDNLFTCVKLDKNFIHSLSKRASFIPFIQSIIDNFSMHSERVIICGVDDDAQFKKMSALTGAAFQGDLFTPVKADALHDLIYQEICFSS